MVHSQSMKLHSSLRFHGALTKHEALECIVQSQSMKLHPSLWAHGTVTKPEAWAHSFGIKNCTIFEHMSASWRLDYFSFVSIFPLSASNKGLQLFYRIGDDPMLQFYPSTNAASSSFLNYTINQLLTNIVTSASSIGEFFQACFTHSPISFAVKYFHFAFSTRMCFDTNMDESNWTFLSRKRLLYSSLLWIHL